MIPRSIYILLMIAALKAQTEPVKDIHRNDPRVWALTHAMVHTEPGDSIKDGTVIIRDGRIEKVGRYIQIPLDAYEIDMEGAHLYAGFIDGWLQIKKDEKVKSPDDHWNEKIRDEYRAKDDLKLKEKELKALHSIGITAAHVVPEQGIFKGKSDLIILNDDMVSVAKDVSQVLEFKTSGWSDRGYPNSLLGVIAVMRQTFLDAEWYLRSLEIFEKYPEENEPIPLNASLSELGRYHANRLPILFMTKEEHSALRSLKIAEEFNLNPWLLGSGYEYRRLKEIAEFNPFIIFPLDFPNKPKVNDPHIALQFSNEQLKHWDMAPDNIKKVFDADLRFSFTSGTLKNKKDFRKNLQKITDRGLSQDIALAALTTYPAEAMGVNKTVGKIQPGYIANLVVTDGNYFDSRSRVTSIWLAGKEKYISERHKTIIAGKWELEIEGNTYDMEFFVPSTYTKTKELRQKALATNKLEGKIKIGDETLNLIDVRISNKVIEFKVKGTLLDVDAMLAFKGEVKKDKFRGEVYDGSKKGLSFNAKRTVTMKPIVREKEMASSTVLYQP